MWKIRVAVACVLSLIITGLVAAQGTIEEVRIPEQAVRTRQVQISYQITTQGQNVSLTTFMAAGDVQEQPDEWWDTCIRSDPKYQVFHEKLDGSPIQVQAAFIPGGDANLGPYTVFAAILGTGEGGWDIRRLGTLQLIDAPRIDPETMMGEGVAIWPGDIPDTAAQLETLLENAGFEVGMITTEELIAPDSLYERDCGLLVLPDGGAYPAEARAAIEKWRKEGGAFLCIGEPGFPIAVGAHEDSGVQAQIWPVADMEDAGDAPEAFQSDQADGTIEYLSPGAADTSRALRVEVRSETSWFYATLPVDEQLPAQARYLEFMARGDDATDRLCVEVVGKDDSRWKYFVTLDTRWRGYSVPIGDFAIYVRSEQNPDQRILAPENVARVKFGTYRNLYDEPRDRTFFVDEVHLSSVHHQPVEPLHEQAQRWAAQYTQLQAQPPLDLFGLTERSRRLEGSRRIRTTEAQGIIPGVDVTVEGVWEIVPQIRKADDDRRIFNDPVNRRWLRLLEAEPTGHEPPPVVAGATVAYSGALVGEEASGDLECKGGSRWGYIGVDADRVIADERLSAAFTSLASFLVSPTVMVHPEPEFRADGDGLRQIWDVPVMNLCRKAKTVSVALETPAGETYQSSELTLAPGETRSLEVNVPAPNLDMTGLGGVLSMRAEEGVIDRISVLADPEATLQQIGEWLIANQKQAGNYSSLYFSDVYGARAQRALSEFTGDDRYRQSGVKMLDMLVENQREDGGWWVGYGPPGEAVFIADDGCLALALTQMASYMDPERRDAYLKAARDHLHFRESFRQTPEVVEQLQQEYGGDATGILEGGLGIGYVLRDYFGEERYDSPRREMRQKPWTLHCSLGFLGALCALDQGARYCTLASKDTDWFLDRVEEGTDSVKSGYANEAAVWMHDTLDNDALRHRIEDHLRGQFLNFVREAPDGWWLRSDGRYALSVPGLVYCDREFDTGPEVTAQLARTIWGMCSDSEPNALPNILRRYPESNVSGVCMYSSFASCALAEILQPRSTMLPEAER